MFPFLKTAGVSFAFRISSTGCSVESSFSLELKLKEDTLQKAIRDGRLKKKVGAPEVALSTKSKRSAEDSIAPMGVGAADVPSRLACSIGGGGRG